MNMDASFLTLALRAAEPRRGLTAPNPAVGAVVVADGKVIATGTHWAPGHPHAEIEAIRLAESGARGSTLYVTLEPCNHFGRTPPCTAAIIAAGISKVVYGFRDPNPKVTGGGHRALEEAGISVSFLAIPAINQFYESYHIWLKGHRPRVTVKFAQSIDGKIAGERGKSIKISGPEFDAYTHERRRTCDALLTTARTVLGDNPRLSARGSQIVSKRVYVIDTELRLLDHLNLNLFHTAEELVLIHGLGHRLNTEPPASAVRTVRVSRSSGGLDLGEVLDVIGREGNFDCWVEAGACLTQALWRQRLVDELVVCTAPKTVGSQGYPGPSGLDLTGYDLRWKTLGEDVVLHLDRVETAQRIH